jgi:dedicator of cytokinesis protein 9/10/11
LFFFGECIFIFFSFKALFTVLDVHDEIYLVARIEKLLDGNSIHASIHPYLLQMNEANRTKAALKLNKKVKQLMKTKLANYRMPFAWACK